MLVFATLLLGPTLAPAVEAKKKSISEPKLERVEKPVDISGDISGEMSHRDTAPSRCWGYTYSTELKSRASTVTQCLIRPEMFLKQFPECRKTKRGAQKCSGAITKTKIGPYLMCLESEEACQASRARMTKGSASKAL